MGYARQKGFTLLEAIIYIALIGFVLTSVTMFSYEFVTGQAKAAALEAVAREGRFANSRMAIEVRSAASIDVASSTFGSHPGELTLETDDAGTDPTVFSVTDGTLYIQQGAGPQLALTSSAVNVTDFTVDNLSSGTKTKAVRISLTLEYVNVGNLTDLAAESTYLVTARVRKNDGFSD
jgi:type II secretory pathway pseudopilin PulG